MALRIPTRTTDHLTVVSYLDTAIDHSSPESLEAIKAYIESDTPDFNTLPMVEGEEPTKFILRPLSEREIAIVDEMARSYNFKPGDDLDIDHNSAEANYQVIRFGLVEVINAPDFNGQKER